MNAPNLPEPDSDNLTAQLFRYAKDMEELMRQHSRLQRHHQMVLQSLGKDVNGPDLLPRLLMQAAPMYWVTDAQGLVRHSSSKHTGQVAQQIGPLVGSNVAQMIRAPVRAALQSLLKRVAGQAYVANAVHCRLEMDGSTPSRQGGVWDALLMQMQDNGRAEIYWFLSPAAPVEEGLLLAQSAFAHAVESEHGVMVANPFGTISSASTGFCKMSGYAEAELVGNNPRLLSSGRHDNDFYQTFWLELLDAGRWSGTIFNRRKSGQIYLQWQTVTMVESIEGEVVSYISATVDLSTP